MTDEEVLRHKILVMIFQGWIDPDKISSALMVDKSTIIDILKELEKDGAINIHTVH